MVFCRHLSCVSLAKSILPIDWNKSLSSNIKFLRSLANISLNKVRDSFFFFLFSFFFLIFFLL